MVCFHVGLKADPGFRIASPVDGLYYFGPEDQYVLIVRGVEGYSDKAAGHLTVFVGIIVICGKAVAGI